MRRAGTLAAALLAGAAFLAGCAGPRGPASPPPPAPADVTRPIVGGAREGLELRVWAVQDQDELIAELIETYRGRPTPMLDSERTAWRASGLWPLAVPIDELNLARGRMTLIGPEQQDWHGLAPAWREIVPGRRLTAGDTLSRPAGLYRAVDGRLRLLARCWSVPDDGGAALQLELAVQHQRQTGRPTATDLALDSGRGILDEGLVFAELTSKVLLRPGEALVLVPVAPGFDPARILEGAAPAADAGPPAPAIPTVGEAMLTSVELGGVVPVRRRAIVVLIARLPAQFRLLSEADSTTQGGTPWL